MALERILFPFLFPLLDGDEGGNGGGDDGGTGSEGEPAGAGGGEGGDSGDEGGDGGEASGTGEPDWKAEARKHERRAKAERKRAEKLEQEKQAREKESQSDQEKAVSEAEARGRQAAEAEASKARRNDRLEVAATRLASRGVSVGEGDDAKVVKFADPEDALAAIHRRITNEEIDPDELFDGDKVNTDFLANELSDVLAKRPHLGGSAGNGKPAGDSDGRKGGTSTSDLEDMTPEDHLKHIQKTKA